MAERVHGGIDREELLAHGLAPSDVVDFSVNLNPYGPCAPLWKAVRAAPLDSYPDPHARAARRAWADALACDPAGVAVGHGAADLFWAIARALVRAGDRVLIAEPTFSEFRIAAAAHGADVQQLFAREEQGFQLDLPALAAAARGAQAVYLCSPNNPTGEYVSPARLRELASALAPSWLVVDQSFIGLSDHADDARIGLPANVLRVRSLTKEFACPGLRIGLCVGDPAVIARIEAARPTWATSSPALRALEVSAGEGAFVRASWLRMRDDRDATQALLRELGLRPLPSATSYQLTGIASDAERARAALLRSGVLVRACTSFGLPRHLRIAALPAAARARLRRALDVVLGA